MKRNPKLVGPLERTGERPAVSYSLTTFGLAFLFCLKAILDPYFETLRLDNLKKMAEANDSGQVCCIITGVSSYTSFWIHTFVDNLGKSHVFIFFFPLLDGFLFLFVQTQPVIISQLQVSLAYKIF